MSTFDELLAEHDTRADVDDDVVLAPDDIALDQMPFDVAFHPNNDIVNVACIDGSVHWYV
jgi:hypothetical protein